MSIARRIRVRIARLHRAGNPVSLGQSRAGFVLAALLVASWQLSTPAQADVASQGSSYNEYFRIEWNYDMDHGLGVIRLAPWGEHLWRERVLEHGRFITAGLPFSILDDGEFDHDVYGPPTFEGVEDGRVIFGYDLMQPLHFDDYDESTVNLHVAFPREGVELRSTEYSYEGYILSCGAAIMMEPDVLPFVTIQTIPEPAAAVSLALAAAALTATRRRED